MILDLKHRQVLVALTLALIAGGAHAVQGQHQTPLFTIRTTLPPVDPQIQAAVEPHRPLYEMRAIHDENGTGKFYMGREIAQVMGPGGIPWLDRPERDDQEKPSMVLDALKLRGGETVVDLGAGSGYFTFRIAPRVGRAGKVLAVEIQDEMLQTIRQRAQALKVTNVEAVKGIQFTVSMEWINNYLAANRRLQAIYGVQFVGLHCSVYLNRRKVPRNGAFSEGGNPANPT